MKRVLLAGMSVLACYGHPLQNRINVRVNNESYDARRVRVYCDGYNVVTLRDLRLNESTQRTVRVASCKMAGYRVETINQVWSPPDLVLLNPGDTLVITIKSYLPLTYHSVRQEGIP